MSKYMEVFVKVRVDSEEEADRLLQASFNGLLSDLIEMWLRHGYGFLGGAPQQTSTEPQPSKKRDPEVELKQVDTEVGTLRERPAEASEESVSKPRGLAGRRKMRRT